ncbi:MAG TPA: hypothetical protein H9684_04020 [Firmicutes bacterium]|nr:hypothetical protein [Bacillota bacterium]
MKNNEDYRSSVRRKADAQIVRQKRRNRLVGALVPTAGCAAAVCAAFLLAAPAGTTSLPASAGGTTETAWATTGSVSAASSSAPLPVLPTIEFAELGGIGIACRPVYDPETMQEEIWTHREAEAYIGRSLIPRYVLPGLIYPAGGNFRAYRNNDGTLAYDQVTEACAAAADGDAALQKRFAVYASRLPGGPGYFFDWPEGNAGETQIGDVSIRFGHHAMGDGGTYENPERFIDWYAAEFTVDGAHFKVVSQNLTWEEFLPMALTLLDEEDLEAAGIDLSALETARS